MRVLGALRGGGDPNHPDAVLEAKEIRETLALEEKLGGEPSFWNMVADYDNFNIPRRVHLTVWLQIMQQLVGIGVVRLPGELDYLKAHAIYTIDHHLCTRGVYECPIRNVHVAAALWY